MKDIKEVADKSLLSDGYCTKKIDSATKRTSKVASRNLNTQPLTRNGNDFLCHTNYFVA